MRLTRNTSAQAIEKLKSLFNTNYDALARLKADSENQAAEIKALTLTDQLNKLEATQH
jgi:hypothetical protein